MVVWRTVQFFLAEHGEVSEVESDSQGGYRCSCDKGTCKHIRFCLRVADENDGVYPIRVSNRATDREITRAGRNPAKFRDLVLKYSRVEVM